MDCTTIKNVVGNVRKVERNVKHTHKNGVRDFDRITKKDQTENLMTTWTR